MSKAAVASRDTILKVVGQLIDISKLDTLFRDLYMQRARALLGTFCGQGSYNQMKQNSAQIPWIEQQLRAGVERGDWKRCGELTQRLRELRASVASGAQVAKLAETVYEHAADISMDVFSSGLNVFVGAAPETLVDSRNQAINILRALERGRQDVQVHHRVLDPERIVEPALRDAAMQRHLAALEAALVLVAGARLRPLVPAAGGLAQARALAAADARRRLLGALGRTEVVQSHVRYSTTVTRWRTFWIMPRIAG